MFCQHLDDHWKEELLKSGHPLIDLQIALGVSKLTKKTFHDYLMQIALLLLQTWTLNSTDIKYLPGD